MFPTYPLRPGTAWSETLTGHGVAVTARLDWPSNAPKDFRPRIYITSSQGYAAELAVCWCDDPDTKGVCARGAFGLGRCAEAERKGAAGYCHLRDWCHGRGGWHPEHAVVLARAVLATYGPKGRRHSEPRPGTSRTASWRYRPYAESFVMLDGEEYVRAIPGYRDGARSAAGHAWQVICDSPHCFERSNEYPYHKPIATVVSQGRRGELERREAERRAGEIRDEHIRRHRDTYGVSGRLELNRWIARYADRQWPEPDREELARQLAIALTEGREGTTR